MNTYTIGEVSKKLNISISTLRYYDKEGLLSSVERTNGGIRVFKDKDLRQLHMLECLKRTGMQLKDIKTFFEWCEEGDSTLEQRYNMFLERKRQLKKQMADLQDSLDLIDYKCEYYRIAMEAGTIHVPHLITLSKEAASSSDFIKEIVGED